MDRASRDWLLALPQIVAHVAERWALTLGPPFPRLSYNYAAPAVLPDGREAVLKLCPVDDDFHSEAVAMQAFGGEAAASVLAVDRERGAMLLERLRPGVPIGDLADDDEATAIAVTVMQRLWRPPPPGVELPDLAYWFRGWRFGTPLFEITRGPLPRDLFQRTAGLVWRLLDGTTAPVLLHGDLNYGNVLSAERAPWLAIDAKGVVGPAGFDTAILLHDPEDRILAAPDPGRFLRRRIDLIAAHTGLQPDEVRDWGIVYALLSAAWSAEDHGEGWQEAARIAAILERL